jgi:methylenetetrahydrofolate dehydrogenase (NADP+) / methenyltetrahydrofolate cyclohydrolase
MITKKNTTMETKILKGEAVRDRIYNEVRQELSRLQQQYQRVPGIAFIGFSGIPLGKYNMPLHVGTAGQLGFRVFPELLPENASEEEVSGVIEKFNQDPDIDAIVILQPIPPHLNPLLMAGKIDPRKEVEGFHPLNLAGTLMPDINLNPYPMCLPAALEEIFREDNIIPKKDDEWVFLLDDEFFSNPLTYMIVRAAASKAVPKECPLTFINKNSLKVAEYCSRADFLVVVSKFPEYLNPLWLKTGVCIIDIYSNLVKEVPSKADPSKLVPVIRGGVGLESVKNIAGSILPVPGGLMTVVLGILFRNTLQSFKNSLAENVRIEDVRYEIM